MAIYKYVSEERIDILQNLLIRFTQPSEFNDPFEANPFLKALTDHDTICDLLNGMHLNEADIFASLEKKVEEQYHEATRKSQVQLPPWADVKKNLLNKDNILPHMRNLIPEYEQMGKNLLESILRLDSKESRQFVLPNIRESIDKTVGILSLTERPDNLLMWAHYSSNHTGFVIQFDETHSFFDRRTEPNELRRYLKKVIYLDQRPETVLYNSKVSEEENSNNLSDNVFWNKSRHWEYEQEWRMIDTLDGCEKKIVIDNHEICLFSIPSDALKGIILGYKMKNEIKQDIINLLKTDHKYFHMQVFQATINESKYKTDINKLTV